MKRSALGTALTALAVPALVGAFALPADAAEQRVALSTFIRQGDGHVKASFDYEFTSRRSATVDAAVWDVCPGDGHGAWGWVVVNYVGGGYEGRFPSDFDGCGNGGTRGSWTFTSSSGAELESLSFILEEQERKPDGSIQVHHRKTTGKIYNTRR